MYQIVLEGKQVKKNQVTGMHLMAGFLLLVMGFLTWIVPNTLKQQEFDFLNKAGMAYSLLGLVIIIICIFFNKKIIQSPANFGLRILELFSLAPILIYSLLQKWYLPAAYSSAALIGIILAFYWERNGKKNRVAAFNDKGVFIPGLGRKSELPWQDITRVLLRHNVLTVDCKDNKLFQLNLERRQDAVNREEFEAYCKIQIEAKNHLYNANW